jgi:hypothetical protein
LKIQFRYGEIWDHIYSLEDEIRWGYENAGEQGKKLVVLDGEAEPCDSCDETVDYLVFVENDVIKTVKVNSGEYSFFNMVDAFIVLES